MSEDQKTAASAHEIERILVQRASENTPMEERESLLLQLDVSRQEIESLFSAVALDKDIYPGWTKKEVVSHLTGWEDGSLRSVQAMLSGAPPSVPAALRGPDYYNEQSVTERAEFTYEQVSREWRLTRQQFSDLIRGMTSEQYATKLIFPWGQEGTVSGAIQGLLHHEQVHILQIKNILSQQA